MLTFNPLQKLSENNQNSNPGNAEKKSLKKVDEEIKSTEKEQKTLRKTLKSKKKALEEIKEKKYKKKDVSTKEASDFLKNFSKEK